MTRDSADIAKTNCIELYNGGTFFFHEGFVAKHDLRAHAFVEVSYDRKKPTVGFFFSLSDEDGYAPESLDLEATEVLGERGCGGFGAFTNSLDGLLRTKLWSARYRGLYRPRTVTVGKPRRTVFVIHLDEKLGA